MTTYADVIARQLRPSGLVRVPTPRRQSSPDGPPCRCCTKPLETAQQPGWGGRPGHVLLTCRTPDCRMRNQTLTADDYDAVDLSRYGAVEHEGYRAAKAAYEKAEAHV